MTNSDLASRGVEYLRLRYRFGALMGEPHEQFAMAWVSSTPERRIHRIQFRARVASSIGGDIYVLFGVDEIPLPGDRFGMSMAGSPDWDEMFVGPSGQFIAPSTARDVYRAGFQLVDLEVIQLDVGPTPLVGSDAARAPLTPRPTVEPTRRAGSCNQDADCAAGGACVNGSCVGTGELRFTLTWDRPGDLDLHVYTPTGEHLYYGGRATPDGGVLDRDDMHGTGPENAFWRSYPTPGRYNICVAAYSVRAPTSFVLDLHTPDGSTRRVEGVRSAGQSGCDASSPLVVASVEVGSAPVATTTGALGACHSDASCASGQTCIGGACVGTGELRFTLTWDTPGDLDLHVFTPTGAHISYAGRSSSDGGQLDRDDQSGVGPENVFWATGATRGTYRLCVNPYSIRRPTNFTLDILMPDGSTRRIQGRRERSGGGCGGGAENANTVTSLVVP
ncbi:MAG: hypothetical protein H6726_19090 [Sandaracinaceae bacterium]|nr:hypothetical protein [Sandaracinaceae bacterium]